MSYPVSDDVRSALDVMSADELRELVKEMLLKFDAQAQSHFVHSLVNRVARNRSSWVPEALSNEELSEILSFAHAVKQDGQADPSQVDKYLLRGCDAFLRKDYTVVCRVFGALLRPIRKGEVDLGQDEMAYEVLGADPEACAIQYVVAVYMTSSSQKRPEAVRAAIDEIRGVGYFTEPIAQMERMAVEPLPALEEFLPGWHALIEKERSRERSREGHSEIDQWLREVVFRTEGVEGLAKMARSSRRANDLRAWCQHLVKTRDWKAAQPAFTLAAEIVVDCDYARGNFLDGAALAAQELGHNDLPVYLERAWRGAPNLLRLRRWLGAPGSNQMIKKRASEALIACPKQSHRQLAFLHLILGDFESAATLLATSPGHGWSRGEHPGDLLFPLFQAILSGRNARDSYTPNAMSIEEIESITPNHGEPHLFLPAIEELLDVANVGRVIDKQVREAMLESMRKAAEGRVEGVTGEKRRRHYGHAASLVVICAVLDSSPATAEWVARIRDEYRRYPALCAELDHQFKRVVKHA